MLLLLSALAHTRASVLTINLPISEYFQEINCKKSIKKSIIKIINQYKKLLIDKKSLKISKSHSMKMHKNHKKYIG
jgi:hypothetical protein